MGPRLERVPLASVRGIAGLLILLGLLALIILPATLQLIEFIQAGGKGEAETGPIRADTLLFLLVIQTILFVGPTSLYVALVRPGERLIDHFGLRPGLRTPIDLVWGALAAVAAIVLLVAVAYVLDASGVPEEPRSPLAGELDRIVKENPEFILLLPAFAAFGEEFLFRGFFQPRIGIFLSSLLFGLVHIGYGTIVQLVGPFLLGLLFGYVYRRLGSLWAPISAHFTFDFVVLGVGYFAPADDGNETVALAGIGFF